MKIQIQYWLWVEVVSQQLSDIEIIEVEYINLIDEELTELVTMFNLL